MYLELQSVQPHHASSHWYQLCPPHQLYGQERCLIFILIGFSHEGYEGAEMWIVEAACAVAKQLELCSTSFPVSALQKLPQVVFSQKEVMSCMHFPSGPDRSHQLTWQQKGWQPVRIPGAFVLRPVSVCWTKWWHEALVDGTHQVSMYFFNLGRKQISWPWFRSRETGRMLITGYKRVTLLRLFCLHALWPDHILALRQWLAVMLKEGQAQLCVLVDPHLYIWKVTHTGSSDLVLNTFCPYSLGRYNTEEAYPAFKTMSYPAISMPYPYSTGDS